MTEQYLVTGQLAKDILQYAGIPAQQVGLPVEGEWVQYGGKTYTILERETYIPGGTTSVDGWHIVYSPTRVEIETHYDNAGLEPPPDPDNPTLPKQIDKFMNVAILGIGAYILGQVLGFFKKR